MKLVGVFDEVYRFFKNRGEGFVSFALCNRKKIKVSEPAWSGFREADPPSLSSLTSPLLTGPAESPLPLLRLTAHAQMFLGVCVC